MIILLTTASFLIILESFNFWNMFLEFIFAGIVPGSSSRISPTFMLGFMSLAASLIIGKTIILPLLEKIYNYQKSRNHPKTRQQKSA